MWQALAGALIPVALGVAVALTPWFHRDLLRPARWVAVVAVGLVVVLELLPAAVADLGPVALVAFVAAFLVPLGLERLLAAAGQGGTRIAVELGFSLLLLHQVLDGLEIGAVHQAGLSAWKVTLGVAAHAVPFVAAITLGFARRAGPRHAALRGLALLIATGAGVVGGSFVPFHHGPFGGWLLAAVAGVMVHVVWHDAADHAPAPADPDGGQTP